MRAAPVEQTTSSRPLDLSHLTTSLLNFTRVRCDIAHAVFPSLIALAIVRRSWRAPSFREAVGTEPTDGSPTGRRYAMQAVATMLTLVLLLMVIDRMRRP